MTLLGPKEQFMFLFNAAVQDARRAIRERQKESPGQPPPPTIGTANSAYGLCILQVTFRQPE